MSVRLCVWWAAVSACWAAAWHSAAAVPGVPGVPGVLGVADYENDPTVRLFREYIRIDTSHPNPNYTQAVEFWQRQAKSLGLEAAVHEYYSGKPVVVITWQGSNTALPSIMLNSHMDVVAADESQWSYPPFRAHMDSEGNIFGRGTQDTKPVGIWYLEAIRRLMADNVTLARSLHIVSVPDEEIFGSYGMKAFVASEDFAALNVGFALDEGAPHIEPTYAIIYGERTPWHIQVNCTGEGGHGSIMKENSAGEKFRKMLNTFLNYRESQRTFATSEGFTKPPAYVNTINLTKLSGGIGTNILPTYLTATFDIRLAPTTNQTDFNHTVTEWVSDAGCAYLCIHCETIAPSTKLDDSNKYWGAFKKAAAAMGLELEPLLLTATTDMRHVRQRGVPALGFSAATPVPLRAHDVDEYLPAATLLRGIPIYYNLLTAIGNV